jgi:hypothetical protein
MIFIIGKLGKKREFEIMAIGHQRFFYVGRFNLEKVKKVLKRYFFLK